MGIREWRARQIEKADARIARADARLAELKAQKESKDADLLEQWYLARAEANRVDHAVMVAEASRLGVELPRPRRKWLIERAAQGYLGASGLVPGGALAGAVGATAAGAEPMLSRQEYDPYTAFVNVVRVEARVAEYVARGEEVPAVERGLLKSARWLHKHQSKLAS